MYKFESHLHTSEASACASASGAEQAQRYKNSGYDGIIVTDHFFNGNTAVREYRDWKDRVDRYCMGYENAKAQGDRIGLKVFFGIEYTYFGTDILVYGIDKDWLYENSDCVDISFYEFAQRVRSAGALMIHAHPFREAGYIHEIRLLPEWVDGVEVYNSGNYKDVMNKRAQWYAEQYGFMTTAGTDNPHLNVPDDRLSGIWTDMELERIEDYIKAFMEGRVWPAYPKRFLEE